MHRRYCYPPWIDAKLIDLRERLQLYKDREREILSKSGVKSYTIGPRSLSRYDTALGDVRAAIADLEQKIAELEAMRCGRSPRRSVGVVPRDW